MLATSCSCDGGDSGSIHASGQAGALVTLMEDDGDGLYGDHLLSTQVPWPLAAAAHITSTTTATSTSPANGETP